MSTSAQFASAALGKKRYRGWRPILVPHGRVQTPLSLQTELALPAANRRQLRIAAYGTAAPGTPACGKSPSSVAGGRPAGRVTDGSFFGMRRLGAELTGIDEAPPHRAVLPEKNVLMLFVSNGGFL